MNFEKIYIISQVFGFISFLINLIAYHRNKKKKIFKTMVLANIFDILHYMFLKAYSGCGAKILALIRNLIIIIKEKNKKINNNIVLGLLFIAYVSLGILTYNNIFSLLPIIAAIVYLYIVWNGDELKIKKVAFYCYFLWLIYNICVFSISGVVSNCVSIVSTYIAYRSEKKLKIK